MSFCDHSAFLPDPPDYPGGPLIVPVPPRTQPFMCDAFASANGCPWPACGCPPDSPIVTAILRTGRW